MVLKEACNSILTQIGVSKVPAVQCTMNGWVCQYEGATFLNPLNVYNHSLLWGWQRLHVLVGEMRKGLQDVLDMLHFPIIALPLHKSAADAELSSTALAPLYDCSHISLSSRKCLMASDVCRWVYVQMLSMFCRPDNTYKKAFTKASRLHPKQAMFIVTRITGVIKDSHSVKQKVQLYLPVRYGSRNIAV